MAKTTQKKLRLKLEKKRALFTDALTKEVMNGLYHLEEALKSVAIECDQEHKYDMKRTRDQLLFTMTAPCVDFDTKWGMLLCWYAKHFPYFYKEFEKNQKAKGNWISSINKKIK